MNACVADTEAGPWLTRARRLVEQCFGDRLVILSPPRSGSTPVARMLWQSSVFSDGCHCHEPFEARYWGGDGDASVWRAVQRPMQLASGQRVDAQTLQGRPALVLKDMCFQLDLAAFDWLAALASRPIVFVMRDPRLTVASRLRIVSELDGSSSFPPEHAGWDALLWQVQRCRDLQRPYVIVDSQRLRQAPGPQAAALLARLGLQPTVGVIRWEQRPALRLCSPEVGALMSDVRTESDPFYRRVLSSTGIQPPDAISDEELDHRIAAAGLAGRCAAWQQAHRQLLDDPNLL